MLAKLHTFSPPGIEAVLVDVAPAELPEHAASIDLPSWASWPAAGD